MPLEIRRSTDRFTTSRPGSTSWHSFSFGHHYDETNTSFGPVVAVNDELLEAGAGFEEHPHAGLVIVTYVITGTLAHQGISSREVAAGQAAVLRCGAGVVHAERNAGQGALRFVQTWLATTAPDVSYDVISTSGLTEVAVVEQARVRVGTLPAGADLDVAGHLFVATGTVRLVEQVLADGDSLRTTEPVTVTASDPAQLVLVTAA